MKARQSQAGPQELFAAAVGHHQRGQLAEAERLYRKVLAADPRHAGGLHYAGVAALQQNRHQEAIGLIEKSLAVREANAEAHYHLGLAFAGLRRFEETAAQNRRAIALKPDYLEAYMNLGNSLKETGKFDEAEASYRQVIALNPQAAAAHYNLANLLLDRRDFAGAIRSFEQALSANPNFPQALQNFGTALLQLGRVDEALAKFDAALRQSPDFPEALASLATALMFKGRARDAVPILCHALDLGPTDAVKQLFVNCITTTDRLPDVPGLERHVIAAITGPWTRARELDGVANTILRHAGPVADIIVRQGGEGAEFSLDRSQVETLGTSPLLLAVLENMAVADLTLERLLTAARRALLDVVSGHRGAANEALLKLACALARQCFINEYVFGLADDETELAWRERDRLVAAFDATEAPDPLLLAVVAAYFPLDKISGSAALRRHTWPPAADALLTQQIDEPQTECALRDTIPRLTPVEDAVSLKVQRQYEENPYPRWVKIPLPLNAGSIDDIISNMLPRARFHPIGKADSDILVAGCGTGLQPLELARLVGGAKILAVDLSLSSLAHSKRKAAELGVQNVSFAQADIVALPAIGRKFDFIVASGVLHHMADAFAAWRGLLTLLRPGGIMQLGLYSEAARRNLAQTRAFIAGHRFAATPDGIRRARGAIVALPKDQPAREVAGWSDFFSLSECRDMLFHAHEQCLTIPQIKEFIEQSGARFLGFKVSPHVAGQYIARFPQDIGWADLDHWHRLELDEPRTFAAMYQFMIQLPPAA